MNKTPSTSKLQGAEKKKVRWCTNEKKRKKKKKEFHPWKTWIWLQELQNVTVTILFFFFFAGLSWETEVKKTKKMSTERKKTWSEKSLKELFYVNISTQKGDVHWASAQIQTSFWTGERVAIGTLSKAWKWPLKEITLFIMTARSASLPFQTLSKGQSGEG